MSLSGGGGGGGGGQEKPDLKWGRRVPPASPTFFHAAPLMITEVHDAESATLGPDHIFMRNADNRRSLPSRFRKQARPALKEDTFVNGSETGKGVLGPSRNLSLSSGKAK